MSDDTKNSLFFGILDGLGLLLALAMALAFALLLRLMIAPGLLRSILSTVGGIVCGYQARNLYWGAVREITEYTEARAWRERKDGTK